jgi:integrase
MLLVGRPRKTNKDLPLGVRLIGGRYYVQPVNSAMQQVFARVFPGKTSAPLGADKAKMREQWVKLFCVERVDDAEAGTVAELIDRFTADELGRLNSKTGRPLFAPSTQLEYARIAKVLRKEFGARRYAGNEMQATSGNFLRTMHIDQYLRRHESKRPGAANHHIVCLSTVFRCARRWGLTQFNPCHGAEPNPTEPRDVVPSDDAFMKVYEHASPTLKCMMDIAQMCGPRRGAIAAIKVDDARDDGLHVVSNKTKRGATPKKTLYQWTPDLRDAISRATVIRAKRLLRGRRNAQGKRDIYPQLFLNRHGRPFGKTGLDSQWLRALKLAGIDRAKFHFHDIRAKVTTESENELEAMKRLAHADLRTTRKVYDRKEDSVAPLAAVSQRGKIK